VAVGVTAAVCLAGAAVGKAQVVASVAADATTGTWAQVALGGTASAVGERAANG
jgi:hypothetical protein